MKDWNDLAHYLIRGGFVLLMFFMEEWIAGSVIWGALIVEQAMSDHPGGHVSLFTPHTVRTERTRPVAASTQEGPADG